MNVAEGYRIGIDVGSTTVKVVAALGEGDDLLFRSYERHEGRQAECLLAALRRLEEKLGPLDGARAFITGSGGETLGQLIGAKFVQEVVAVSVAVERSFPDVGSVIELGGQDSKIVVYQETGTGQKKKLATMNDKCAGGTGSVIEKIAAKLGLTMEQVSKMPFDGVPRYRVAGKCGVFAETDITGLQKQGVTPGCLIASLFQAIVFQNLTVLTRGHQLRPRVLLLGGPHVFLPGLRQAWVRSLTWMWKQQEVELPPEVEPETLITVPADAQYYGAAGAMEYGREEAAEVGVYCGTQRLAQRVAAHDTLEIAGGAAGLVQDEAELTEFLQKYTRPQVKRVEARDELACFIGIDGGSTSTKAAVLDEHGELVTSAYRLSKNDPIHDAREVLKQLRETFTTQHRRLRVLGAATTGYSKDLLQHVFGADVALVETVAHAHSALRVARDVDVIVDVGGQDIKIMLLEDGTVKDFRLNTQCSAGNGYFLQSAAESLGIPIEKFAETAFQARRMPLFSYGCAVFLQADIVNFQRQGWRPEELVAGLAAVLPKNVFLYVARVSNVAQLGRRFLLQGGTQRNLAVVKAEVDFLQSHYFAGGEPEVMLHPHCGEAGAIGAALEARRLYKPEQRSTFVPLNKLETIKYKIKRDDSTQCSFCANRCERTFIDYERYRSKRGDDSVTAPSHARAELGEQALAEQSSEGMGHKEWGQTFSYPNLPRINEDETEVQRMIVATCERGESNGKDEAKQVNAKWAVRRKENPCIPSIAGREAFRLTAVPRIAARRQAPPTVERAQIRVAMPRVLNLYTWAPLFAAYLQGLGIAAEHISYSSVTTPELYQEAVGIAAIDPCFPAKVSVAHVYELLRKSRVGPRLDYIFFPMIDSVSTKLEFCQAQNGCPTSAATPEAVRAAFTTSKDWFAEAGTKYLNPVVNLDNRELLELEMFECWQEALDLEWEESRQALRQAFAVQERFVQNMREQSRQVLDELERSGRMGLVLLGRPYLHDPGLNHDVLEAFQKLGYPVLSQSFLPLDDDLLERLFGEEVRAGLMRSPLEIGDVWKNSTSANSNVKLWAAKFTARHPNLIPFELASFKCGHDAFVSQTIDDIAAHAGKPHFYLRDLDENKPLGSLRLRIETIDFFLRAQHGPQGTASDSHLNDEAASIPSVGDWQDVEQPAEK